MSGHAHISWNKDTPIPSPTPWPTGSPLLREWSRFTGSKVGSPFGRNQVSLHTYPHPHPLTPKRWCLIPGSEYPETNLKCISWTINPRYQLSGTVCGKRQQLRQRRGDCTGSGLIGVRAGVAGCVEPGIASQELQTRQRSLRFCTAEQVQWKPPISLGPCTAFSWLHCFHLWLNRPSLEKQPLLRPPEFNSSSRPALDTQAPP